MTRTWGCLTLVMVAVAGCGDNGSDVTDPNVTPPTWTPPGGSGGSGTVTECTVMSRTKVSNGDGPSTQPAVVATDNGYLLAWADARAGGSALFTATVATNGGVRGTDTALAAVPAATSPELAAMGGGRYMMVFESCGATGLASCDGASGVGALVVNGDGQAAGGVVEVSPAMAVQRRPYVTAAYGTTYTSFRELDGSGRAVARVVTLNDDGSPGNAVLLGGGAEGLFPYVSGNGNRLAATYRRGGGGPEVMLAVLDQSLGVTGEMAVRTGVAEEAHNPAVAWNGSGWSVAWEDDRSGDSQITAAAASPDASQASAGMLLYDGNSNWPAMASSGHTTVVAFYAFPKGAQIVMVRLDASGNLAGQPVQVTGDADHGKFPSVTYNSKTGDFGVAWQDDGVGEVWFARVRCP